MLLNQFKACSINLNAHHMNGMTQSINLNVQQVNGMTQSINLNAQHVNGMTQFCKMYGYKNEQVTF